MDIEFRILVWTVIIGAFAATAIVLMWPLPRRREVLVERRIAASPRRVWETYVFDPAIPDSAAFHNTFKSLHTVASDPETVELTIDASGGHGTHHSVVQIEIVASDPPRHRASRYLKVDDRPLPYGPDNIEELLLEDCGGATTATLGWRGDTATLGQYLRMKYRLSDFMDSLKRFCETGAGVSVRQPARSPVKSIGFSLLAFGSFAFIAGWQMAVVLSVAIVIHEFGHWLAMRMTGQPKPRIMMVPFLGGVAVPNHPFKTQFDGAFVALMGAGLSAIPCLLLIGGIIGFGGEEIAKTAKFAAAGSGQIPGPWRPLLLIALVFSILNAIQLLPVLPLDGGHILRSVLDSTRRNIARIGLLVLVAIGIGAALWIQDYILLAILSLGAMHAWHHAPAAPSVRPMGATGLSVIGIGYLVVFGIHAGTAAYAIRMLGIDLF